MIQHWCRVCLDLRVSSANSYRCAAPPPAHWSEIHKWTQHYSAKGNLLPKPSSTALGRPLFASTKRIMTGSHVPSSMTCQLPQFCLFVRDVAAFGRCCARGVGSFPPCPGTALLFNKGIVKHKLNSKTQAASRVSSNSGLMPLFFNQVFFLEHDFEYAATSHH